MRRAGILLIAACLFGFLTVADDLRHVGELVGVGAIGVAGSALYLIGHRRRAR